MKRSMGKFPPIFLFLSFFYIDVHPQVRLLGIWNNLGSQTANVSIKGSDYRDIQGTPFVTNKPFKLPQTINVKLSNREYSIVISEPDPSDPRLGVVPGNSNPVRASILGDTAHLYDQVVFVTNATSRGIIGREVYGFQNVMLFLGTNPGYTENVDNPFVFGLSAWTSTKPPWDNYDSDNKYQIIENPADDQNTTFAQPLRVTQGHAAIGGGLAPRMGHANITHIYNNTPNILQLERHSADEELSKYNFTQLVPPYSAVPFAMIWVPKNTSPTNWIKLSILRAPKAKKAPPKGFGTISEIGSKEAEAIGASVPDLIEQYKKNTTDNISKILGDKSYDDLMKSPTKQYLMGDNYFKIFTDNKTNDLSMQTIPLKKGTGPIQKIGPACIGRSFPQYFKLTVNETVNADKSINILPEIKSIPEEIDVN